MKKMKGKIMYSNMIITENGKIDAADNADEYIKYGISVIPTNINKAPICPWKEYQSRLPNSDELREWFWCNDYNVAIVTGRLSGIAVLDIDSEEAYALAMDKGLPETPTVKTGRGFHLYFKYQDGVRNFHKRADLPGIDLRGEGGCAVAPPSLHMSGTRYQWVKGKGLDDLPLAELPDWVLAKAPDDKKPLPQLVHGVSKGERNETLTRLAGSWVKTMSLEDATQTAIEWNMKCDPPDSEQQVLRTIKSIWDTENSGLPEDIGLCDWEEPVLFDNVELPKLSAELLPSYLGEFAGAVSRAIQAPEGMATLLGLSVAATALQKKVAVGPDEHGDYVEPVNVWTVVVADPSERKSPVLREMMGPVVDWGVEQCERIKNEKTKADTERALIEARIKKLSTEAGIAETAEKRAEIATQINELKESMPDEVKAPYLWTGSVTPERLEQLMVENNEKMSVLTDEGGIFEIMGGLYTNGKMNLDVFMQGYSGNPTRTDRAGRKAHMKNPLLTLGLAIQPKVLEDLSHGSKRGFRGTGLLARFLYYQCETFRGQRLFANQQQVNPEVRHRYVIGIKALLDIPLEYDDFGNTVSRRLYLDDESRTMWIDFHDEIETRLVRGGEFEAVADWAGKLAGNTLRVAGLFHVVEHGLTTRAINRETMDRAIQLMRVLIPHAKSALSAAVASGLVKDAEHVCEWIANNEKREFSKRDCQRAKQSRFQTVKELEPVLAELIGRNIIRVKANPKGFGRPSDQYESNPALFI